MLRCGINWWVFDALLPLPQAVSTSDRLGKTLNAKGAAQRRKLSPREACSKGRAKVATR